MITTHGFFLEQPLEETAPHHTRQKRWLCTRFVRWGLWEGCWSVICPPLPIIEQWSYFYKGLSLDISLLLIETLSTRAYELWYQKKQCFQFAWVQKLETAPVFLKWEKEVCTRAISDTVNDDCLWIQTTESFFKGFTSYHCLIAFGNVVLCIISFAIHKNPVRPTGHCTSFEIETRMKCMCAHG